MANATHSTPVFVAANQAEEAAAEQLLTASGIAFDVVLAAAEDAPDGAVCYLRVEYRVSRGDAARARSLLIANGLSRGIVAGS